jgi:choline dehydrogenase-like flavoprotein
MPPFDPEQRYDVLVIGGGNAALCAAISARRAGASVLVLEAAPHFYRGGNTRHTRNMRCAHDSATEILTGPYTEDEFWEDLKRVTQGHTDQELARYMIAESKDMLTWIVDQGVRFQPSLGGTLSLGRTNSFFLGGGRAMLFLTSLTGLALFVRWACCSHCTSASSSHCSSPCPMASSSTASTASSLSSDTQKKRGWCSRKWRKPRRSIGFKSPSPRKDGRNF